MASTTASQKKPKELVVDAFALRQFDVKGNSSCPIDFCPIVFEKKINEIFEERKGELIDGYAPFCKHIFVPNFVGAHVGCMPITPENEQLLRTGYEARTERELAVLNRWFPKDAVEAPLATHLDVILYSREQIFAENEATGNPNKDTEPWGIISIKPQLEDFETPMSPITMMRNALPKLEGGSGVALDRDKYRQSVQYWETHALIK